MANVSLEVWLWLGTAIFVMLLAGWNTYDGIRTWTAINRAEEPGLWRIGVRNVRTGIIALFIGIVAIALAAVIILGEIFDARWLMRLQQWLPYGVIAILMLVAAMLAGERYDRYLYLHPRYENWQIRTIQRLKVWRRWR